MRALGSRGTIVVAAAALTLACNGDGERTTRRATARAVAEGEPVPATMRVEGGVTVLEHDATALARAPRLALDPAPLAVLGGAEGDAAYDLTFVRSAVLLRDGRIATFSPLGSRLLVFRGDGRGERVIGRQGRGPGELMSPRAMVALGGDTLFLLDDANARLNWVLPDHGVVASRPFVPAARLMPASRPAGVLPDGRVVLHAAGLLQHEGVPDSVVRPPTRVALLDPDDGAVREMARVPDLETVLVETRYRGRRHMQSMGLRLGRRAHVAVWDSLVVTGSGEGYAVELRAADGRVVSRLRVVGHPRRAVSQAMRDVQVARELERFAEHAGERLVDAAESRRLAREAPFADSLPPYDDLFVTPDRSTLWVVDAVAPGDTAWSATAFRADGAIVARLHATGAATPVAFGDDRVVVRTEDELGVVTLRVHRLVPGDPPS